MIQGYQNSPIIPDRKKYLAICWQDQIYVQHNAIEGLSSAGGIQGFPTDTCIEILRVNNIGPIFNWVDDFTIFRSPSTSLPLMGQHCYDYDLTSFTSMMDPLGIPWHPISKKGQTSTCVSNILASAGTCAPRLSHFLRRNGTGLSRNSDVSLTHPTCLGRNVPPCMGLCSTSVLFVRMPAAPALHYWPSYQNFPMILYYTFCPAQSLMT